MNPYPAYRPSGVEWLGEVPEHWEVKRLEHVASYQTSSVDKKVEEGQIPVRLCNYTDVYYQDRIRASRGGFMEATATRREIARFRLEPGDVVITKDSEDWQDIGVPALVDETADDFVCGYHLGIIRPRPLLHPSFLFRLMQSGAVNQRLQTSASGVTRYGLPNSAVSDVSLPLPPLDEQRAIAAFLDRETERIDALVAKMRLLIERLQENRTALITRTVTRGLPSEAARAVGLDPSPRLKPSGVEWLGDVPEHWEVLQPSFGFARIGSGTTPHSDSYEYYDGDTPWVTTTELRETTIFETAKSVTATALRDHPTLSLYPAGALVTAMYGATIGRLGILGVPATVNQACCVFAEPTRLQTRFVYYWLLGFRDVLISHSVGGGQPNLSQQDLRAIRIPAPDAPEQVRIADFLYAQTMRLDKLVRRAVSAIERLQEYRTALITAAVTGKVDVREPVAADGS